MDFDTNSNSFYNADVCGVSGVGFFGRKKRCDSSIDLFVDGDNRTPGVCKFYFRDRNVVWNDGWLYDRLDFFGIRDGNNRETSWKKIMGKRCFYDAGIACLLHCGYDMVFSYLYEKRRSNRRWNSASLVRHAFCDTGFGKIRTGAWNQPSIRKDYKINVREK